jgi:hypothetical protein
VPRALLEAEESVSSGGRTIEVEAGEEREGVVEAVLVLVVGVVGMNG